MSRKIVDDYSSSSIADYYRDNITLELEEGDQTQLSDKQLSISETYKSFTHVLQNPCNGFDIVALFDAVENLLTEEYQFLRLNYKNRIERSKELTQLFNFCNVPVTSDTVRAVINCVNREMARRGRKMFD
jgi:hypothetical protein